VSCKTRSSFLYAMLQCWPRLPRQSSTPWVTGACEGLPSAAASAQPQPDRAGEDGNVATSPVRSNLLQ
jgi:hypothetical protein